MDIYLYTHIYRNLKEIMALKIKRNCFAGLVRKLGQVN
jgi:hypothetical protein